MKKPVATPSKMRQTKLDELFKLIIIVVDLNKYNLYLPERDIKSFTWDKRDENQQADDTVEEENFKEGYINYLKKTIKVPYECDFYDTKSNKSLLSFKHDMLPFEINGMTDVVIAKKAYAEGHMLARGIKVGFELKKKIQDNHIPQAIGQLLTINIRSNDPVFIVLTDLNNEWIFYWLEDQKNKIKIMQFTVGLNAAISIIESTLNNAVDFPLYSRRSFHDFQSELVGGVGNLTIKEVASEEIDGLELFFNRHKVNLEFEDDVTNMKDVYDVMSEEEINNWKIRRALRLLSEAPDFQSYQSGNDYLNT
jgi:hypothetical protein